MQPDEFELSNAIPTGMEDWQSSCRDLAASGKPFAVLGFKADHWEFFNAITREYHYELRPVMSKLIFVPLESAELH